MFAPVAVGDKYRKPLGTRRHSAQDEIDPQPLSKDSQWGHYDLGVVGCAPLPLRRVRESCIRVFQTRHRIEDINRGSMDFRFCGLLADACRLRSPRLGEFFSSVGDGPCLMAVIQKSRFRLDFGLIF